jgi:putative addiction module component (TIGR02574 family)
VTDAARKLPPGFDDLPVQEQIEYVQFLWDHIAPRVEEHPVPDWHQRILDERIRELESDPDTARPADEVAKRLRGALGNG